MRKLIYIFVSSIIVIIGLVAGAFLLIDLNVHKSLYYNISIEGDDVGSIKVDRYITENKIIFKSDTEYVYYLGYPIVRKKLILDKRDYSFLKFHEEAEGVNGQKRLVMFLKGTDSVNFLFEEYPKFLALNELKVGEEDILFSPDDILLHMPVMEKYNYRKKGKQYFNVVIPAGELVPPLRETIAVEYIQDEYILIMGRKVEAESFVVSSKTLPKSKIYASKYSHKILALEIAKMNIRFVLVNYAESSGKRGESLLTKVVWMFNPANVKDKESAIRDFFLPERSMDGEISESIKKVDAHQSKDIFFKSDGRIVSGKMWVPDGEGHFPAVLIVAENGPRTKGDGYQIDSLGKFLSTSGFLVVSFNYPGKGGNFIVQDDKKKTQDISAAVFYLKDNALVDEESINLIGFGDSGYLVTRVAKNLSMVRSCILFKVPVRTDYYQSPSKESIRVLLNYKGFDSFEEEVLENLAGKMKIYFKGIKESAEDFNFFMGIKLPQKEYKDFLMRNFEENIDSFTKPILLVLGKDDKNFDAKIADKWKRIVNRNNRNSSVAVFRNLGDYLGNLVKQGDAQSFVMNADVCKLVENWIAENCVIREDLPVNVEIDTHGE